MKPCTTVVSRARRIVLVSSFRRQSAQLCEASGMNETLARVSEDMIALAVCGFLHRLRFHAKTRSRTTGSNLRTTFNRARLRRPLPPTAHDHPQAAPDQATDERVQHALCATSPHLDIDVAAYGRRGFQERSGPSSFSVAKGVHQRSLTAGHGADDEDPRVVGVEGSYRIRLHGRAAALCATRPTGQQRQGRRRKFMRGVPQSPERIVHTEKQKVARFPPCWVAALLT